MGIQMLWPEWLYDRFKSRVVLAISAALFLTAVGLERTNLTTNHPTRALYLPLFSVLLYLALRAVFLRHLKREPRNVAFNFERGLIWDRLLAFIFWMGSAVFLLFLIAPVK